MALRKNGFRGRIVGCDQPKILVRAKRMGAIHACIPDPIEACNGSGVVVLATPVGDVARWALDDPGIEIFRPV